jgi:hypothetical protein
MNIAIIYHDADFDGKLSNEVCRYHLNRLHNGDVVLHSYGWDYGRPVPTFCDGVLSWLDYDQIYIVDLSVDELMERHELREKIIWIDHHKSAIEKWDRKSDNFPGPGAFTGIRIDGVAACRLCWNWFTWLNPEDPISDIAAKQDFIDRNVSEPTLIRLAGEYDVWDHRDPNGKILQFGLRACSDREFRELVQWQFDGRPEGSALLDNIISGGQLIKSYCDKMANEYSEAYAHTIYWEGLTFCALNIGQRGNSDLLRGGLKPEHDACFAWRFDGSKVMVSLYHAPGKEQIDLSEIAKRYGGGGHRGACGFRMTLSELAGVFTMCG